MKPLALVLISAMICGCSNSEVATIDDDGPLDEPLVESADPGNPSSSVQTDSKTPKQPPDEVTGLNNRIHEMIDLVEAGNPREAIQQMLPPSQLAEFLREPDLEDELASFNDRKAPRLLQLLKSLDVSQAEFSEDKAVFQNGSKSVTFIRIDGIWYLMN